MTKWDNGSALRTERNGQVHARSVLFCVTLFGMSCMSGPAGPTPTAIDPALDLALRTLAAPTSEDSSTPSNVQRNQFTLNVNAGALIDRVYRASYGIDGGLDLFYLRTSGRRLQWGGELYLGGSNLAGIGTRFRVLVSPNRALRFAPGLSVGTFYAGVDVPASIRIGANTWVFASVGFVTVVEGWRVPAFAGVQWLSKRGPGFRVGLGGSYDEFFFLNDFSESGSASTYLRVLVSVAPVWYF
jgi:hypothetical protein